MTADTLIALAIFAGVLVCTPGPANMLLMAAGANSGLRACVPLIAGVTLGKLFVHSALALGLWGIITRFPLVLIIMKIAGAVYILYLAWKIFNIQIRKNSTATAGFFAGLAVHPLNPKAWAMVASAYGQFISSEAEFNWWTQTIIIALVFMCWQIVAHTFWCWSGARAAHFAGGKRKILTTFLAVLMLAAVGWSLFN